MARLFIVAATLLVGAAATDDGASLLQEGNWPGVRPTQPPQPAEKEPAGTQPMVIQIPTLAQNAGGQPQVLVIQPQASGQPVQSQVSLPETQVEKPRVLAEVDEHEEQQATAEKAADTKSVFEKEHIYIPKKAHDPYKHGKRNNENNEEWYHSVNSWNTWFHKKMQLWQKYRPFDAQVYKKWLDDIKTDSAQRCKWIGTGASMGTRTTDDLYAQVTQCMWGMMMSSQPLPPFTPPFVQKLLMEEQAELKKKMDDAGLTTENAAAGAQQMSPELEMTIAASQTSPLKNQWMFALIPHIHRSEGWDIKHR